MRPGFSSEKYQYIRSLYAQEDPLLQRVSASLPEQKRGMQVSAEEGAFLAWLVAFSGAKRIVEIGTCAGYSAIWMARALPMGGQIHTIERDSTHASLARTHFSQSDVSERITLHEGVAADILLSLSAQAPFDMVFIDADKSSYPHYLDWAEKNIKAGGLIVADNTLLFGALYGEVPDFPVSKTMRSAMQNFNERLADRTRFHAMLLPTQEGLSVAIRR